MLLREVLAEHAQAIAAQLEFAEQPRDLETQLELARTFGIEREFVAAQRQELRQTIILQVELAERRQCVWIARVARASASR